MSRTVPFTLAVRVSNSAVSTAVMAAAAAGIRGASRTSILPE